jgi:hypothetical protein
MPPPLLIGTPLAIRPRAQASAAPRERRSSFLGTLLSKPKPLVDITLDDPQHGCFVPSYTTLETIKGHVAITSPADLRFDELHINFQGTARTFVEKMAPSSSHLARTAATHTFLRMVQPISRAALPADLVFRAGSTYRIAFTFVVPEHLLPQACTHGVDHAMVKDAHMSLPPSLGDPMMASDGKTLLDDLSPDMTVISYGLRVLLLRRKACPEARAEVLTDSIKKLRIIPRADEQPPLRVSGDDRDEYVLKKQKMLRKGIFQGQLGVLTLESTQPRSIHLPAVRPAADAAAGPPSTMAVVDLRFDPAHDDIQPPGLSQLWVRLKIATFFASVPMRDFPSRTNAYLYDTQRGIYVETLPLSSRSIKSAQWTAHQAAPAAAPAFAPWPPAAAAAPPGRRDSAISFAFRRHSFRPARRDSAPVHPCPPPASRHYTTQLLVPVELPATHKTFVPTFHSCLASRVYALDLTLTVHPAVSTTHVHLKLPLQLSAAGNALALPTISASEAAAIARREVDSAFAPRSVAPPIPEYTERAQAAGAAAAGPERRWSVFATDGGWRDEGSGGSEAEAAAPPEYNALGRRGQTAG